MFERPEVADIFHAYPPDVKEALFVLRQLILDTAAETDGVGELQEVLRWGQPSYMTVKPKSGTTIRIDQTGAKKGQYGLYVHCQTDLIARFQQLYPHDFQFEGKRAIIFESGKMIPTKQLQHCIAIALTYHQQKRKKEK